MNDLERAAIDLARTTCYTSLEFRVGLRELTLAVEDGGMGLTLAEAVKAARTLGPGASWALRQVKAGLEGKP